MKLIRALFRGWGVNQFNRPEGVWVTQEQIDELVRRQYDPDRCDKPMRMGNKWVYPKNFLGEDTSAGKRKIEELVESSSTFSSDDIIGLAEAGYLGELSQIDCGGYNGFVKKLVDSKQYKLEKGKGERLKEINQEGLKKLEEMKSKSKLGGGLNEN